MLLWEEGLLRWGGPQGGTISSLTGDLGDECAAGGEQGSLASRIQVSPSTRDFAKGIRWARKGKVGLH